MGKCTIYFSREKGKTPQKEVETEINLKIIWKLVAGRESEALKNFFTPLYKHCGWECKTPYVKSPTCVCTSMQVCMCIHTVLLCTHWYMYIDIWGTFFIFPAMDTIWPYRQKPCTPGLSPEAILFCSQRSY